MKPPRSSFSRALRLARNARGISQELFDEVSSRTYVSALERGLKSPTLPKVDALSGVLGLHPLTLLALSYGSSLADVEKVLARVDSEAKEIFSTADMPIRSRQ